jgi:hypothetical protein
MRYQLIDTVTGEVVREMRNQPPVKVYHRRPTAQIERDVKLAAFLAVLLVAALIVAE